ncbi:Ant1p KNAG_0A07830 [Huiozyma naganishii CBS 8797]|uniref:Uncharacterized protein n=1 Tax=Huiozyma naganishii (strain ATCC MYA-139 / BCRC 22969 / CBS 8797 / KCTC 17520 / NBRC 10181 / NCYC 3082 / Yp74L-3) TaxID=1071383 RepID=J7R0V0_HUIN7|nr:hypothetical protein KNAG_0A07830 [Kazachstania naganishii CBS 8797]CCK68435.1 hypothetical protein KNAG_0A07830 [Kazachstania naganishii CBS 8797]
MATLESAIAGAVSSALANAVVYPLDLSKTLIQSQTRKETATESQGKGPTIAHPEKKYRNVIDCMVDILKQKGPRGLYQGLTASTVGTFVMNFCYFFWYTLFRQRYINMKLRQNLVSHRKLALSTLEELAIGVVAAAMSQVFTSPIAVIATRQQTSHDPEQAKMINVIKQVYKESNGDITAFWKGLKVGLMLTLNPSITYASYQRLKKILFHRGETSGSDTLTVSQNFTLGVISKMISTLATQPLIVAKASLQRAGSKFKTFQEVLLHYYKDEGLHGLWKGVIPQLVKGVLVQGLLFAFRGELIKLINKLLFYSSLISKRKIKAA